MSDRSQVTIRLAGAADAQRLTVLCGQLGYPASLKEVERHLAYIQQDDQQAIYVAGLPDGTVVGWIHVHRHQTLMHDPEAEIGGLVVDEACRGQGIGQRLLQQAEQWARERGYLAVCVRSNVIRKDAHRFYERLGYGTIKTQRVFRYVLPDDRPAQQDRMHRRLDTLTTNGTINLNTESQCREDRPDLNAPVTWRF
jgi:GNAT superfamily N-acetyltransferase